MDRDATLGSILRSHDSRMQPIGMEFMSSHNTPSLRGDLRLTISMYEIGHLEECLDRARVIRALSYEKNWSVCYVLRISNDGFNALESYGCAESRPRCKHSKRHHRIGG